MTIPRLLLVTSLIGPVGAEVTFYRDALPVLQRKCQTCHRPGEIAPMPLLDYVQARPWAKAIKQAVLSKKMPPWFADPHFGKFTNDLSLNAADAATLVAWVDGGAREGNASDAPAPVKFTDGWQMPKPDAIFEIPEIVTVPATGIVDYHFYAVPTNFKEDRWVEMVEVRPTNRSVVHHAIVYARAPGEGYREMSFLGGFAPGSVPQKWKPGQARLVKAGSILMFQIHYATNGKPGVDRTQIGMTFSKQPAEQQILAMSAVNHWFEIPPGVTDFRVDSERVLSEPVLLVGLRPHMHLRGKAFEFRVAYPNGHKETLLSVPRYDFNWQPYYYLETPLKLPRGARIECTAHFDNSPNNPYNPNPRTPVTWGEQSWEEMMIGWFDVAVPAKREGNGNVGALTLLP